MRTARDCTPDELETMRRELAESLSTFSDRLVMALHREMRAEEARAEARVRYDTPEKEKRWACCRCGVRENPDNSAVTWSCESCNGRVCHNCTLRRRDEHIYYDHTFCSQMCLDVFRAEKRILYGSEIDDADL